MTTLVNYATSSSSTPRGLSWVAYSNPEYFRQVKSQIKRDVDLSSAKIKSLNGSFVKEEVARILKEEIRSNSLYGFVSDSQIEDFSDLLWEFVEDNLNSLSSYSDSAPELISEAILDRFPFIQEQDSLDIAKSLIDRMQKESTEDAKTWATLVPEEISNNDNTKIDSLPQNSVIPLKSFLSSSDFLQNTQAISSFLQDPLQGISNLTSISKDSLRALIGYPLEAINFPGLANGIQDAVNLANSTFASANSVSGIFTDSFINLDLQAAILYNQQEDPNFKEREIQPNPALGEGRVPTLIDVPVLQ